MCQGVHSRRVTAWGARQAHVTFRLDGVPDFLGFQATPRDIVLVVLRLQCHDARQHHAGAGPGFCQYAQIQAAAELGTCILSKNLCSSPKSCKVMEPELVLSYSLCMKLT